MGHDSTLIRDTFCRRKAKQFASFLRALSEAHDYSRDLSVCEWDFAIKFSETATFDLNLNDIRWMIGKDWIRVRQVLESENISLATALRKDSQFVISEQGREIACELSRSNFGDSSEPHAQNTPDWDFERRELLFQGKLIKRFRWPAPNQETILSVFSEEGWPVKITDPLPQSSDVDPKRRLGDTIKCLNRNQACSLIRFRGDGTGEGIIWQDLSRRKA